MQFTAKVRIIKTYTDDFGYTYYPKDYTEAEMFFYQRVFDQDYVLVKFPHEGKDHNRYYPLHKIDFERQEAQDKMYELVSRANNIRDILE
jgi:hypothetical protein